MIRIIVRGQSASCVKDMYEHITTGLVGKKIYFSFSDEWDGYAKVAVFTGSDVTKDVLIDGDSCTIPPECLTQADGTLGCGIYGSKDGEVTPTIYCTIDRIRQGADPSGDPSVDPDLPVWAQIQNVIGDLAKLDTEAKDSLVAAINEAFAKGVDEDTVNGIVEKYLQEHPPEDGADGKDGADGEDGHTPVKGEDYWTSDDQQTIVNDVLAALPVWEGGSY